MKFLTCKVYTESSATICQKSFPTIFRSHLEILRKMQKRMYLENSAKWSNCNFHVIFEGHLEFLCNMQKDVCLRYGDRAITTNVLPAGCTQSHLQFFGQKSFSCHFLAAILNFCIKCKK